MFTTGDKLLSVIKEVGIGIMELFGMSGVPERTMMNILADIRELELGVVCRIADRLGICVHELRANEELVHTILEKLVKYLMYNTKYGHKSTKFGHMVYK